MNCQTNWLINAHKIKKDFYENKAQGWPQSQKLKDRQYEYL